MPKWRKAAHFGGQKAEVNGSVRGRGDDVKAFEEIYKLGQDVLDNSCPQTCISVMLYICSGSAEMGISRLIWVWIMERA
jgi:hypothetical protein